jgi:DNA-binding transcriptional MerR regulator
MSDLKFKASISAVSQTKAADLSIVYRKKKVIDFLRDNRIVDINGPNLAYFLRLGIVIPDVANPSGRAETKYYSTANLFDIAIARTLENRGLSLKAIAKAMDSIRDEVRAVYDRLKNIYRLHLIISNLNTDNSRAYLQINEREVKLNMDETDSYLVVDLSKLISRMKKLL